MFGECLQDYGCAWCDARSINPAFNPLCMSLFETSQCPLQTKPELIARLPEEPYPACDPRCEAIGLRDPCIEQPGCGWCAATGRCMSGSFFRGPCKTCPSGWALRYGNLCRPGYGGEAEALAGGDCTTCKCQNGGTCNDVGECDCPANVTGTLCQTLKTRVDACHGNGDWDIALDDCVCDEGFVGVGDNRCAFECDPVGTCGGRGYCSELTGKCVCDTVAAGPNCECVATPLTTYPFADPLKNEESPGCCGYGFEPCPARSSNAGRCVLAPADDDKCPVFREDNTTLVILVVIALLFGAYLGAAVIAYCQKPPQPSCRIVARLPEVLLLREVLFKRSELDTRANEFMEIEVPLVHNFWRVKRMIARRLKTQPDPENITLWYMGSELHNKWKLMDGVNCGDTVHVKIKLKNVEATEFVKRRAKFWARVWAYLTEDNIVGIGYIFGFFVLFTALVRWPSDPDRATPAAPPPPPLPPSPPPPFIVNQIPPPPPPQPPTAPPPPPAAWVAIAMAQNTITNSATFGEASTLDAINVTLPDYLNEAAGVQGGNSTYNDMVAFSRTEAPDGSVLYYKTHEDAPLWPDQLPEFFDAEDPPRPFQVIYRTSCYPNLASQYQMFDNGVIQYQPEPNINGQDYMTYFGLVAESVAIARGLVAADLVDCDNKVENMCVTNTVLANILIEPRNDAPVAANAEPVLYFTSTADFIVANNEQDETARHQLPSTGASPQRLIRNLVGYDVDGDLLKYTITGPPLHGHAEIIQEGLFFYVPDPGFMGSDYFQYTVDDSRSNAPEHVMYDQAYVVVQVGLASGLPQALPSNFWVLEDHVLEGKLYRTPAAQALLPTFTYIAVTSPAHGELEILCAGQEVTNTTTCTYEAGNAYFRYTPDANYYGEDSFVFGIESSSTSDVTTEAVNITVRPVNDVPTLQDQEVEAVMNRGKNIYSFSDADLHPLSVIVTDTDDVNFTMHMHRIGGPVGSHGRFFRRLDAFGRPTDEIDVGTLSQDGVFVQGGTFQAYYMAPPLAHGLWTEQYAMRARDGSLVSNPSVLTVNIRCSPGFIAESDSFGTALTGLGLCEACPLGSVSSGYDATVCGKCPLGMFSGDGLSGQCSLCPAGTYADVEGLVFCKACPLGSTSAMGAITIEECFCSAGYYGTPGNCRPCPNHGRWNEIGKWTYCVEDNLEVPLPQPGFYVVQAEDPMEEPVSIRQCFPDVSCPGLNVPAEDAKVAAIAAGEWEADEVQCQVGYTNEGCDTCESGYFRLNSRCAECPPLWQPYLFGTFMMSLILFCVLGPWYISEQSPSYHIIISAMTIITYSQDIGLFGRYFLHWDDTKEMRALLKWAFLFQLNPEMLALECTQNVDFVQRWRSLMSLPAVLAFIGAALLLVYFVWFAGQHLLTDDRTEGIRRLQKTWVGCMRSCIALATVMYAGLTVGTLDMFVFHTSVTDGRNYLRAAPALRFGLMQKSETWYQLLPGAVFALVMYPMMIIIGIMFVFYYASQRWKKLWIRDLVGWSTYAYRDDVFWFRVVEMLRFLCFAVIQIIAYRHDESSGLAQALAALVVIALSMSLLLSRPYKRYRKKLLEFTILISHGIVLLMSTLSLAPTTTEITEAKKIEFRWWVFTIIVLTYLVIIIDVSWSVVEELPVAKELEYRLRDLGKDVIHWATNMVGVSPPEWVNQPDFDDDEPMKSIFKPSAETALRVMAEREGEKDADYVEEERWAFAKSMHSLLKHRLVKVRISRRDVGVVSYPKLFQSEIRATMMASAALEDVEHNRLVMAFIEKRLLREYARFTHRKFYNRVKKKLESEGFMNPLLENWLRRGCAELADATGYDEVGNDLISMVSSKTLGLFGGGSTKGRRKSSRSGLLLEPEKGPGPVTEARAGVARIQDKAGTALRDLKGRRGQKGALRAPARPTLNRTASRQGGFLANINNHSDGKLTVAPKGAAKFAKGSNYADVELFDEDVVDLDFEAEVFSGREYEGKVHFLRREGYFDDLHQEWDRMAKNDEKTKNLKDLVEEPDDVEGGAVLPWHFQDEEEDEAEPPPDEIVVPKDTRPNVCCVHICKPGMICIHGNKMPEPEYYTEVIERDYRDGPDERTRRHRVEVPVWLHDTSETVKNRVFGEMQTAREDGKYDDEAGGVPEVLNLQPEQLNLVHRAAAIREPTTMQESKIQWKAEVTLQGKRGGAGRSAATLVLRDDLSELGEGSHTVVHTHTKEVINNKTRIRELIGRGARAEFKVNQTVRDLREAAAEAQGIPFERVILRYRTARAKEIINDAATLERKKLSTLDDVIVEEEPVTPYYVYHEVRRNFTFFESVFRVYASIETLDAQTYGDGSRKHLTTSLVMSEAQFVRLFAASDLDKKLTNTQYVSVETTLRTVFRSVKARPNTAEQMELLREEDAEIVGALAPSKLRRLARRLNHPNHLAFDEFISACVLMGWMTYGFRVPQTWDRGVARSLRFFVERVMRISVTEMYDAHELLKQFAAARTAEGVNHAVSQEAMVVYRHFSKNSQNGMSVEQWREFVDWYVTNSSETKKYTELIFYTHVAPLKGEPAWVEEGCRRGKVAPIGDDDWDSEVKGLTFPRFMVAFSELSFRAEAREGGTPSVRLLRGFRRAMQRREIIPENASDDDEKEKVIRQYDPNRRNMSESSTSSDGEEEEENMDYGESWVPHPKPPPEPKRTDVACQFPEPGLEIEPPELEIEPPEFESDDEWRDPFEEARERAPRPKQRRRRVVKKQVVVTTTQNVVKKSTTQQSAKVSVVDIEVASRKKAHKATNLAYAGIGAARAADSFSRAIRESSDEGSDDEEVGTDAWKEQQEKRRARYRMTTTSSELYDVQSVREEREEQERLRVEHERATREKREALEKKWMESGTQTVAGGGASGRSGTKFATKIEEGWNKDYAAKSTGLTAKEWERV